MRAYYVLKVNSFTGSERCTCSQSMIRSVCNASLYGDRISESSPLFNSVNKGHDLGLVHLHQQAVFFCFTFAVDGCSVHQR